MAKKTNYYFETFIKMIDFSCQAADHLKDTLSNFSIEELPVRRRAMHKIEHTADLFRHEMMSQLVKEFVTPIDREDIILIANTIDTATDMIEDILIHVYMYNITEIREDVLPMVDVIAKCCQAVKEAVVEFPHFHKSTKLRESFIAVDQLENDCDLLYIDAVHKLFQETKDPVEKLIWSELYESMEECCDACAEVVGVMEVIVMKNS